MVNLITVIAVAVVTLFLFVIALTATGNTDTAGLIFTVGIAIEAALIPALAKRMRDGTSGRLTVRSSDGHYIKRGEDLTCETNDGHNHEDRSSEFGRRYIVHNEPNEGYVVLNGIMHKIEDCKNL